MQQRHSSERTGKHQTRFCGGLRFKRLNERKVATCAGVLE